MPLYQRGRLDARRVPGATIRSPAGAASAATTESLVASIPVRRAMCSRGFAMVAEQQTNRGVPPYLAHTRRSLRSTRATCEPKTPW